MAKSPKKTPPGVEVREGARGGSLRIRFQYRGVECAEAIKLPPTPQNIQYARRLREEILSRIGRGNFNYYEYFPDSARARQFGHANTGQTLSDLFDQYLIEAEKTLEYSTFLDYRRSIDNVLRPQFGKVRAVDLSAPDLRAWIKGLNTSAKRVRNILTPLRAVLGDAVNDDLIPFDPLDRIDLARLLPKEREQSDFQVDPLTTAEQAAILNACRDPQERNLFQFALWTGLRTGELVALRWDSIDWQGQTMRISRSYVAGREKAPKTRAGFRDVVLLPLAIEALEAQKQHTYMLRDHVFHNPRTRKHWGSSQPIHDAWNYTLRRAGVRYRNPYQTRHTYASMLLSAGERELWVAQQMGHRDVAMVRRHYGRWINIGGQQHYRPTGDYLQGHRRDELGRKLGE